MAGLLQINGRVKISRSIGDGLISCYGVQTVVDPNLTVWRFRLYAEILFSDVGSPGEMPDTIWASSSRQRS